MWGVGGTEKDNDLCSIPAGHTPISKLPEPRNDRITKAPGWNRSD